MSRCREIATPAQTPTAVLPSGQEYLEWVNPDGKTRFVCAQSHCRLALKNKQGAQKHVEDKVCRQDRPRQVRSSNEIAPLDDPQLAGRWIEWEHANAHTVSGLNPLSLVRLRAIYGSVWPIRSSCPWPGLEQCH